MFEVSKKETYRGSALILCGKCGEEYEDNGEGCPACKEAERPFYRKNLNEPDKNIFSIRLNPEERQALDEIKQVLDLGSDGTALKLCAFKGWVVLQRTFGRETLRWLCDKERTNRGLK